MTIEVEPTPLAGLLVVQPRRFGDNRGFFEESWSRRTFAAAGIDTDFVQDNTSLSATAGTLRGLHFQAPPHAQAKLVRCTAGSIFDVAVDVRNGSPTYGQWFGVDLTADNGRQLFVPKGFLHGFVTRQPDTVVQYRCSDYYAPECDRTVRWDSAGIDWPLSGEPILSDKDAAAAPFASFRSPFEFGEPS